MEKSPEKIYTKYLNNVLDKSTALIQLISLIDNSESLTDRVRSIIILGEISAKSPRVFNLLENLLISDNHEIIRFNALRILRKNFKDKALKPMTWALNHEKSLRCLLTITDTLGELDNPQSKGVIIDKLEIIQHDVFKIHYHNLFKIKAMKNFTCLQLAEILKNYLIINQLEKKFGKIRYKLRNGLIMELDLSDVSSHVYGWNILKKMPKFIFKLNKLKRLDLKFNRLSTIPESIKNLSLISHLDLSYNKIKELPRNIGTLKSLLYLNLRYNQLSLIPDTIGNLTSLKILNLRSNKLTVLPKTLNRLRKLEILDLYGNKLNNIKINLKGLSSL
ncbi:MAG: hypothetical protein ACFFGP_09445, partial [Promethearchaeota archaeon]